MKTNLNATNATMNVIIAAAQKELTGTNSGQTDVWLRTLNVTIATNAMIVTNALTNIVQFTL